MAPPTSTRTCSETQSTRESIKTLGFDETDPARAGPPRTFARNDASPASALAVGAPRRAAPRYFYLAPPDFRQIIIFPSITYFRTVCTQGGAEFFEASGELSYAWQVRYLPPHLAVVMDVGDSLYSPVCLVALFSGY